MNPKQRAGEKAIEFLRDGMTVGLGTGSTADYFLLALGAAIRDGRLRDIRGVPTSRQSEDRANELGIPLTTLADHPVVDATVDGADEVDPQFNLIKGLGGALLREKIVAQHSRQFIIVADRSKLVPALGTQSPLPVEVIPFGHETYPAFAQTLGGTATLRLIDGRPFMTDNGNYIYHCRFAQIADPAALDTALHARAGVIETGLFIGMAGIVLIGHDDRVETRRRDSKE
jgi:ribose 5-phosphate isomerase A